MSDDHILAWDIGGAHLKAAYLHRNSRLLNARQWATPIWQGLDCLDHAMAEASQIFEGFEQAQQVATTTAELVDIFSSREDGIQALSKKFSMSENQLLFYAGDKGFVQIDSMMDYVADIASANWHATCSFIAKQVETGVMIDIGSTTTDIIAFEDLRPIHRGYSDHERLLTGELVYSGMIRTAVMALVKTLPFRGKDVPVMAEHFATTADVYRLLGWLNENDDYMETADGKEKTFEASARRLARMIGIDFTPEQKEDVVKMAEEVCSKQLDLMQDSLIKSLNCLKQNDSAVMVGAGCGRKLSKQLSERLDLTYLDFHELLDVVSEEKTMAANCATAVSLAHLAEKLV